MTRSLPRLLPVYLAALAALPPAGAAADTLPATTCPETSPGERTCALFAKPGATVLPGLGPVTIWGYAADAAGAAASPGPALVVNQGDRVTVSLSNGLAVATSIHVTGQVVPPDLAGVAPGGAGALTFVADRPGTFLYEAGALPGTQYQAAMGLFGAFVVRPAPAPATPQAFEDPASAYDDEALVVLSELDPALNGAADPAAFDLRTFAPTHALINGRPYPDATPIPTGPGRRVLLRYANAGTVPHAMALLGATQATLAVNAGRTPAPLRVVSLAIPPGQTADAVVAVPAGAAPGTRYTLFDAALALHNGSAPGIGGMLTFLVAGSGTPGGGAGPLTSGVTAAPSPTAGAAGVTVTATCTSGGPAVAGAELFLDAPGAPGAGAPLAAADGAFDAASEGVSATIDAVTLGALATGPHAVYVRGRDATGAWGPLGSAVLLLDHDGPTIAAFTATPPVTSGAAAVVLAASGDDRASGGAAVVAAELFLDPAGTPAPGSGGAMTAGPIGDVTGFTATIPAAALAALTEGAHTVVVRARDGLGNWGPLRPLALAVDRTGPAATAVAVSPAVTDGFTGVSSGNPSLRVTATLSDPGGLAGAEGFVDTAGAAGTGFALLPVDGRLDGTSEGVFADVPLTTISHLAPGAHAIVVRGRDRAGNWGALASGAFVYDPSGALFADGFESGDLTAWNGGVTGPGLAASAAARMGPSGAFGLAVSVDASPGYVTDGSPAFERSYRARFWFDPNSTGSTSVWTLFSGVRGAQVPFAVQYRRTAAGAYQVRLQLLTAAGTVSSAFTAITDAPHLLEVAWSAGSGAGPRLRLWVDGAVAQTLSGQDTSPFRVDAVRLGRSAGALGAAAGTLYFDGFASSRGATLAPATLRAGGAATLKRVRSRIAGRREGGTP